MGCPDALAGDSTGCHQQPGPNDNVVAKRIVVFAQMMNLTLP